MGGACSSTAVTNLATLSWLRTQLRGFGRAAEPRRHTRHVRITIRVRPGSARPGVGGELAGALIVRVSARAAGGQATEAALAAVAAAFGVRRAAVTLVAGASGRTKIVDIADGDPRILAELLAAPGALAAEMKGRLVIEDHAPMCVASGGLPRGRLTTASP